MTGERGVVAVLPLHSGAAGGARIRGIRDVVERQLCAGCGVCAYLQPDAVRMVDVVDQGRRPLVASFDGRDAATDEALAACPGVSVGHDQALGEPTIEVLRDAWGPVLEVWEGYAADPEIRFAASSGGAATALALHGIQEGHMHGVLHIAAREDIPYLNRTVLSTSRDELLAATGSRYAPASPCDGLQMVEDAPRPCVFIGKPCDVAGARAAAAARPVLASKLGLTIAIFCAGTPTLAGTFEMMRAMGIDDPGVVAGVRYRGNGWPGMAEVEVAGDGGHDVRRLSYQESWGHILQRHRQWRCHVCADHTGELADVAVGDPWYRPIGDDEPGRSLVLVRTDRGRTVVRAAVAAGALVLEPASADVVIRSQPELLRTRGAVWGRTVTLRAIGLPAPRFRHMPMRSSWMRQLTLKQKAQSVYGTLRRVVRRRLYRRRTAVAFEPPAAVHGVATAPGHDARDGMSPEGRGPGYQSSSL